MIIAIVLAAGKGTRMVSDVPGVACDLLGKPIAAHALDAAIAGGADSAVLAVSPDCDWADGGRFDKYMHFVSNGGGPGVALLEAFLALEANQASAGRASVYEIADLAKDPETDRDIYVAIYGNAPLIKPESVRAAAESVRAARNGGRSVNTGGARSVNTGGGAPSGESESPLVCFTEEALRAAVAYWTALDSGERVRLSAAAEVSVGDVASWAASGGAVVRAAQTDDPAEFSLVRDHADLAEALSVMRARVNDRLMREKGVRIMDPSSVYIDCEAVIGRGAAVYPGCYIDGGSVVGEGAVIGPDTRLSNSVAEAGARVERSVAVDAFIGEGAVVGPFAYLRPGTRLAAKAKAGSFVEIKNADVGAGTKIPHLSYIGDADVGANVNIGCGVITCNYDGKQKYRTKIGNNAFVGSNANLVAPVELGDGCYVASGSTVTDDVPAGALGIARGRQENKRGWTEKRGLTRG